MNTISGEAYWDSRSQSYINGIEGPYHANRLKMVEALLEGLSFGSTDCLDFGCGDGVFAERLLVDGARVTGVDVDQVMVKAAQTRLESRWPEAKLVLGGVEAIEHLPDASFDFLFALNVRCAPGIAKRGRVVRGRHGADGRSRRPFSAVKPLWAGGVCRTAGRPRAVQAEPDAARLRRDRGCEGDWEVPSHIPRAGARLLAYLNADEEESFYRQAQRVLRPGGALIVTHSNELFDTFTFNRYTVNFFKKHFSMPGTECGVGALLTHPDTPDRFVFSVRENPLAYRHKLKKYEFTETRQEFAILHSLPPLLTPTIDFDDINSRTYPETTGWPEEERWKLMFMCSIFGSLSVRND